MLFQFLLNLNPSNLYNCLSQVSRYKPSGEGGALDTSANLSYSGLTWISQSSIWGSGTGKMPVRFRDSM
ncbi:hypothetical protein PL9214650256 [Planktothrix tepida PCC 9214]|uniref:Uncharacterized protein n=1 Tax=Planktothrix tepida PCC 9214 TaxID=671072 RepID=A0A1J1LTD1_9CYAN|nr:hypothetical protein PL9214650256 [Planktothrix tepida PCC 9214]